MKIYESEKTDGLEEIISKQSTIACVALAKPCKPFNSIGSTWDIINSDNIYNLTQDNKYKLTKASNRDQIDLFYLQSILVSTGWNKNDDVFDPQETWNARSTPEDKPFNFMHNEKDIIGHITGNAVVDFNGNLIDDQSTYPESFNIITNAVIYKCWSDQEQRERIEKITAEINEGKWFVSMECLFPAFDYALMDASGSTKVIERNEASAFLTKHLRAYGGDGLYENYKVGRLLRNLSFSGKGLVSKPANPKSIILDGNKFFDETKSQVLTISSAKENDLMSLNLENKIAELQAELAQAKLETKQLMEQVATEKEGEYQSKIQALEAIVSQDTNLIAEKAKEIETLVKANKELLEAAEAAKEDMKKKDEEMMAMKKKAMMMKRKAQLQEVGLDAEEANATAESFESIDDESFEKVIALMKKKGEWMKKDKKDAKKEEMTEASVVTEEVLDQAEPVEEVAVAQVEEGIDQAESLRAVASEWLASVLQTVPKNK